MARGRPAIRAFDTDELPKEIPMKMNPYLHFNGQCKEAFAYYQKHLGGEITMAMTYAEAPDAPDTSSEAQKRIIHTCLVADGLVLMGSDNPPGYMAAPSHGVTLALLVDNAAEADRLFAALSDKGEIRMPMQETFFSNRFGMCVDQFGTAWMVNFEKTQ